MTTPLTDLLPHLGELTTDGAERWVAAALAEASALCAYDDRLYPLADGTGLEAARRLHEAWRRWADQAEALLAALGPAAAARVRHVLGLDDCASSSAAAAGCGPCPQRKCAGVTRGWKRGRRAFRPRGRSGVTWALHLSADAQADLRRLPPPLAGWASSTRSRSPRANDFTC